MNELNSGLMMIWMSKYYTLQKRISRYKLRENSTLHTEKHYKDVEYRERQSQREKERELESQREREIKEETYGERRGIQIRERTRDWKGKYDYDGREF